MLDGEWRAFGAGPRVWRLSRLHMDRYSDMVLFMGLLILYARLDRTGLMVLVWVAAFGSFMTSYARARPRASSPTARWAPSSVPSASCCSSLALWRTASVAALWIIAILSNVTALQRVIYTYVELRRGWTRPEDEAARRSRSSEPGGRVRRIGWSE